MVQTLSGETFLKLVVNQGEAFTLEAEARTVDDEIVPQSEFMFSNWFIKLDYAMDEKVQKFV